MEEPAEAPAFILQGRFHVYLHRIQESVAGEAQQMMTLPQAAFCASQNFVEFFGRARGAT